MDKFFSNWWRHSTRYREDVTPGIPNSTAAKSNVDAQSADYAGHVVKPYGQRSLLVPAWYRGVTLIMQTMGQMVVQYQRKNAVGGNFCEDDYGEARLLNYLLQVEPNPLMTGSQLLEQIEYKKIYRGNAYVYIDYDVSGSVRALYLCREGSYNPIDNTYALTYNRVGGVATVNAPASQVLHFKNVITDDGLVTGRPTIDFAMKALSIAATADEQTLKDMAKGGKHKIIVQERPPENTSMGLMAAGRANKNEMQKITDQLGDDIVSKDVMLLSNVADTKIISQTAAELRTLENRGFEVTDLARLLGVPTAMMMVDAGNNYKTPEGATQEFLLRTIQPRIREMEDELNRKLLGPGDFGKRRIHVCEMALRRLDPAGQAAIDKANLETGVKSPNELRAQYDLPTIEDGDIHYVSTNLAVVGSEKLRSAATASLINKTEPKAEQKKAPQPGGDPATEEGGAA